MLLQKLKDYNEQSADKLPVMYKRGKVNWFIDLDREGKLVGEGFVATSSEGKKDKGITLVVPHIGRASGIKPILLVDKADYVLGFGNGKKVLVRHDSFVELVRECVEQTDCSEVKAIWQFLISDQIQNMAFPAELKESDVLSFRVEGCLPTEKPIVQKFWAEKNTVADCGKESQIECHICGCLCTPVTPHPVQIKGLGRIGGQTSGMALVSANSVAFESYGLNNSLIAPTCSNCAESYASAANDLISKDNSRVFIGPIVYIFWTKNQADVSNLMFFNSPAPEPEQVQKLILSAQSGQIFDALDEEEFYATVWSASGARIAVRDWIETTVGKVRKNTAKWFQMQKLDKEYDNNQEFYGIWGLAASLYHSKNVNAQMVPQVPEILLRTALEGERLPSWLLFQAVKRNRAEQKITRPRAILIKMVLASQANQWKEDYLVELDLENKNAAYLCGRLLAELEAIQRVAINANATIIDRFYGSASSAPASVFGYLLRGAQSHLAKLRKEKPGLAITFQSRLEEIQGALQSFPRVLTLEEQGLFALGYYHQRANDRKKKSKGKGEKEDE